MYFLNVFFRSGTLLSAVLLLAVGACSTPPDRAMAPPTDPLPSGGSSRVADWNAAADSSTAALLDQYWNAQDQYFNYSNQGDTTFHYWPQAHALEVMLDAYARTRAPTFVRYMNRWYEGVPRQQGGSFLKEYYDDMEWNALAMLRAYEATGDEKFKAAVDTLWAEIKTGWTDVAGGGIMWSKDTPKSKNAISNAPASVLASRLYQLTGNQDDLDWAKRTYAWQKRTLVDSATGAVWDHVAAENGREEINKDWIFTYNQGMFVGAALELYQITGDGTYLDDATASADYALRYLTTDADPLLVDEGDGDGGLFKGIFVRYLTQLALEEDLPAPDRRRYASFIAHNAATLWTQGTDQEHVLYGTYWKDRPGREEAVDLTVQLSGAMLIEAAARLEDEGLLKSGS